MGRVREGRVLKLEGNPNSATSGGKTCGLGQSAVQAHWSPDRLTTPMIRESGSFPAGHCDCRDWTEILREEGKGFRCPYLPNTQGP